MVPVIQDTNISWWMEMVLGISVVVSGPWSGPHFYASPFILTLTTTLRPQFTEAHEPYSVVLCPGFCH